MFVAVDGANDLAHRDSLDLKDFYWTIRGMKGPEILEFRKRIRDEIGLQNLR